MYSVLIFCWMRSFPMRFDGERRRRVDGLVMDGGDAAASDVVVPKPEWAEVAVWRDGAAQSQMSKLGAVPGSAPAVEFLAVRFTAIPTPVSDRHFGEGSPTPPSLNPTGR